MKQATSWQARVGREIAATYAAPSYAGLFQKAESRGDDAIQFLDSGAIWRKLGAAWEVTYCGDSSCRTCENAKMAQEDR